MTKRTIDLDQIRVVQADNYKGNPRLYLEIMDQRILYSSPYDLLEDDWGKHFVSQGEHGEFVVDTNAIADMFRSQLGHILAEMLLQRRPDLFGGWSTDTDREIDYVKPRLEEDPYL